MCDSCEVLTINGIPCHEHGCPDAWRDYSRVCKECGTGFTPEFPEQRHCDNYCYAVYNGLEIEEPAAKDRGVCRWCFATLSPEFPGQSHCDAECAAHAGDIADYTTTPKEH